MAAIAFDVNASPPPAPVPMEIVMECSNLGGKTFNVPPQVVRTLYRIEGGKIGTISRNPNGSFDLGPLQVNTVNLPDIQKAFPFLTWRHITYHPCINFMVGSWFLSQKIKGRNGDVFEGVGDYHSKTPEKRIIYLRNFFVAYGRLVDEEKSLKPSETARPKLNREQPVQRIAMAR